MGPEAALRALARADLFGAGARYARGAVAWISTHTGVPTLVVAAVLLVVGYRLLQRSFRFFVEVAVVLAALVAASHFGLLRF